MIKFSILCCLVLFPFFTIAQSAQEKEDRQNILVLEQDDPLPTNAKAKGRITVSNAGKSGGCSYLETIARARWRASRKGANVIYITKVREPKEGIGCYKIWAKIFFIKNTLPYLQEQERKTDSLERSLIADTAQYAILYIYRPTSSFGSLVHYQVNADDTPIGRAMNGIAYKVKITKEGELNLWGSTESKTGYKLQVKFGKVYFIKCGVQRGFFFGLPDIHLVRPKKGLIAYKTIRQKMQQSYPRIQMSFITNYSNEIRKITKLISKALVFV